MIGCPRRDYMPTATTNRHGSVVVEYDEYPQAPHRRGLHPHRMRPARRLIDIGWFECYDLHWGKEPLQAKAGVVGGGLGILRQGDAGSTALLNASTCPGAYLTAACYSQLKDELRCRLAEALPVDSLLLPLHGAAVAEGVDDPEGVLIEACRQIVGPVRRGQESDELPQRLPCRGQGRLHSGHARAYAGDARNATFERMDWPFFPADDDIPGLQPTILQ